MIFLEDESVIKLALVCPKRKLQFIRNGDGQGCYSVLPSNFSSLPPLSHQEEVDMDSLCTPVPLFQSPYLLFVQHSDFLHHFTFTFKVQNKTVALIKYNLLFV
jgi:hypothetical protein